MPSARVEPIIAKRSDNPAFLFLCEAVKNFIPLQLYPTIQTMKKVCLIILDGFGEGKPEPTNAIFAAKTLFIDSLRRDNPWGLLEPGGASVGVLPGQTGGSDVGHNTMGTGQVVRQPIKIIHDAIEDKSFFQNKTLKAAIDHAQKNNSNVHLFGIGSDSFVHAYTPFLYAILDVCRQENFPGDRVFLHLGTDGRDNPQDSAPKWISKIEKACEERKVGRIASLFGRILFDRGKNWKLTEKLYDLFTVPTQSYIQDWRKYLEENYKKDIYDQLHPPVALGNESGMFPRISDGDSVINFNFRSDRERQITAAFASDFSEFNRKTVLSDIFYAGMIPYSAELPEAHALFEEEQNNICLAEVLEKKGLRQLHISGSEKFIFVTYNFDRCKELELAHEAEQEVPQTREVDTFDKNPEMSAPNLTKILLEKLEEAKTDVYIINYENCDQVGHTGNLEAAIQAVETVDQALSQVIPKMLEKGFEVIVTADHGNADIMVDEKGGPHTAHTHNKVPFIFISSKKEVQVKPEGTLVDIAPTILDLLEIEKPVEMIGESLIV